MKRNTFNNSNRSRGGWGHIVGGFFTVAVVSIAVSMAYQRLTREFAAYTEGNGLDAQETVQPRPPQSQPAWKQKVVDPCNRPGSMCSVHGIERRSDLKLRWGNASAEQPSVQPDRMAAPKGDLKSPTCSDYDLYHYVPGDWQRDYDRDYYEYDGGPAAPHC